MNLKKWFIAFAIFGVVAYGAYKYMSRKHSDVAKAEREAPIVDAAVAKHDYVDKTIKLSGIIRPAELVTIKAEIDGYISSLNFVAGENVEKDRMLIQLDDKMALAEVKEYETAVAAANVEYKRAKSAYNANKAISESEYAKRAAELEGQKARLETKKVVLAKHKILAPFSGYIGISDLNVGEYVSRGKDLVKLVNYDKLYVDFKVPEIHIAKIEVGSMIELFIEGNNEQAIAAEIVAIDHMGDSSAHSFVVRAAVVLPDVNMRPGQFVLVKVPIGVNQKSVFIPENAIIRIGDHDVVVLVIEGIAKKVIVSLGEKSGGFVEVLSGVSAGDIVVTTGQMRLRDGVSVKFADPAIEEIAAKNSTPLSTDDIYQSNNRFGSNNKNNQENNNEEKENNENSGNADQESKDDKSSDQSHKEGHHDSDTNAEDKNSNNSAEEQESNKEDSNDKKDNTEETSEEQKKEDEYKKNRGEE